MRLGCLIICRGRQCNLPLAMLKKMLLAVAAALALVGCVAESPIQPVHAKGQALVSVTCTPGEQMCDFCCSISGGPSSDDCIVQCNDEGTGWETLANCGWAQGRFFMDSCVDTKTGPVCRTDF